MWQLMLGGVFDRHPELQLVMTEVRGDWLPGDPAPSRRRVRAGRGRPARRSASRASTGTSTASCRCRSCTRPRSRCATRSGIETIFFGRDYPHAEGTWPNTVDWLSDAFAGVPEDELRLMLGENAIRVLGLDRPRLAAVAERIGPTVDDITGRTPDLDPRLIANWDARGGYLKPPERFDADEVDALLREDIALAGS